MKKIIAIFFVFYFIYSCIKVYPSVELYKKLGYKGIITKKYNNPDNHGSSTFLVRTDSLELKELADLYLNAWYFAKVGDSIIKPPDTLMIIIKRNDSTFKEFFFDPRFWNNPDLLARPCCPCPRCRTSPLVWQ